MIDPLEHRGPDDSGVWVDAASGIGLGHRRLSIIDLSENGHQPMPSASGRYRVVFNGEIYNFRALGDELRGLGHSFRGHSDTEILLASVESWGLAAALEKFVGMFAFALWDDREHVLCLARDRLGEKPLYYGWQDESFVFASELKSFCSLPGWQGDIDRDALALHLRFGYIPAPFSIYRAIYKLVPGTFLSIRGDARDSRASFTPHLETSGNHAVRPQAYWSVREVAERESQAPLADADAAVEELDSLLRDVVENQMIADVPLGAFLSGGIDSSTVVALMQTLSNRPVKTFTIGFEEKDYNEAEFARDVARHLGTDHTELCVTAGQALDVIPSLGSIYDEPFADPSQIPTILVSKLARENVTVSLSGDGGDELFCGYNRYFWSDRIWRLTGGLPRVLKSPVASLLASISPAAWDGAFRLFERALGKDERLRHRGVGTKAHKLANALRAASPTDMYRDLVSYWKNPTEVVLDSEELPISLSDGNRLEGEASLMNSLWYWDQTSYLPDDNLVKVDRASMNVSLESRAPLLDHRVVEFSWRLPLSMKFREDQTKWILRQVLHKYVPRELIERPKMGFSVPIGPWLRGPLRDWCESLLAPDRLSSEGFFDVALIRKTWADHLSGKRDFNAGLWSVLMFQEWHEAARKRASAPVTSPSEEAV
jgi:asparagine synthase (glutamine-hydrolysing)